MTVSEKINRAGRRLCTELSQILFSEPVTHVYNPLVYAREAHECYVERYGNSPKRAVLLGMNPGPFGMAQTGVPFGEVSAVRDWLKIETRIERPACEHPKRPVLGFDCPRSEVSGRRLWGACADWFANPEAFFRDFFVANYCPLVFMEQTGRNRTPDKLPAAERTQVFDACDTYLRQIVAALSPEWIIGIGAFAEGRARDACDALVAEGELRVGRILHPSPASPLANRDWPGSARRQLQALGLLE